MIIENDFNTSITFLLYVTLNISEINTPTTSETPEITEVLHDTTIIGKSFLYFSKVLRTALKK